MIEQVYDIEIKIKGGNEDEKMNDVKVGDKVFLGVTLLEIDDDDNVLPFYVDFEGNRKMWIPTLHTMQQIQSEIIQGLIDEIMKIDTIESSHMIKSFAMHYELGAMHQANKIVNLLKSKLAHQHDWKVFNISIDNITHEKYTLSYTEICDCGEYREINNADVDKEWVHQNIPAELIKEELPKVGDTVRIIGNGDDKNEIHHHFKIGVVGKIVNTFYSQEFNELIYQFECCKLSQWVQRHQFEVQNIEN